MGYEEKEYECVEAWCELRIKDHQALTPDLPPSYLRPIENTCTYDGNRGSRSVTRGSATGKVDGDLASTYPSGFPQVGDW